MERGKPIEQVCEQMLHGGVDQGRLEQSYRELKSMSDRSIGYPVNQSWDYHSLFPFLELPLNNVGDPYQHSNYKMNTLEYEREVIDTFAHLAHAPEGGCWGYVTNGGTEGNMYGLYLARELYPRGVVYFSEESHYSVPKILRLQHTPSIMLQCQPNGEMDYDDLRESLKAHPDRPPIIFANIGTTMKGAVDRLDVIRGILAELGIKESYIHADCALHGLAMPFINDPPPWHFADGADSLAISGHKWIGTPVPCGIALARRDFVERISRAVEYVGVMDTTITGSRSAFSPLMLWYALRHHGEVGLRRLVRESITLARYAVEAFRREGVEAWRNQNSPIVVFPRPADDLVAEWSLAIHEDIGHMVCLPYMDEVVVDEFVAAYVNDRKRVESER